MPTPGRRPGAPSGARRPGPAPATKSPSGESSGPERLQKILAHAGVGSRRACEELILQGRVTIGGKVVKELGTKVDLARDPVAVDGQKVQLERPVYFAVYKPKGYVSTNDDPSGRPRVLDLLPEIPQRVYTVGRLDEMSVGLMLLTNDGELANKLAHPKFGVEKLYRVTVAGSPPREVLSQLTEGIWLAEGKVRAKRVRAIGKRGDSTILELVLAEGKNREVRRMLAKLGHKVMTLTRVAVGPITVKGLTAGQFRPLTGREVDLLRRVAAGQPVSMPWMTDRGPRREAPRPRRPESSGLPSIAPARATTPALARRPEDAPRNFHPRRGTSTGHAQGPGPRSARARSATPAPRPASGPPRDAAPDPVRRAKGIGPDLGPKPRRRAATDRALGPRTTGRPKGAGRALDRRDLPPLEVVEAPATATRDRPAASARMSRKGRGPQAGRPSMALGPRWAGRGEAGIPGLARPGHSSARSPMARAAEGRRALVPRGPGEAGRRPRKRPAGR